jgi:hypothetical protein
VITANSITPFLPVDSTGKNGVMEFSLIINRVPRVQFPCQTRSTPGSCWSWFMIRENSIAPFLPLIPGTRNLYWNQWSKWYNGIFSDYYLTSIVNT